MGGGRVCVGEEPQNVELSVRRSENHRRVYVSLAAVAVELNVERWVVVEDSADDGEVAEGGGDLQRRGSLAAADFVGGGNEDVVCEKVPRQAEGCMLGCPAEDSVTDGGVQGAGG